MEIGKLLIIVGVSLVIFGAIWHFGSKFIPFGKLPGDFSYKGENFSFYFPLASSIIISIVFALGVLVFRYFKG